MTAADRPQVVNVYISYGRLVLLRRDEQGELRSSNARAEYSLFVRRADLPKIEKDLRASSRVKHRVEGEWVRVVCPDYDSRARLVQGPGDGRPGFFAARGVETFEADLSPVKRWLIDSNAVIQKPHPGYLDLEWDSRVPFSQKEKARILCWSLVKPDGDRVGGVLAELTDAAERELLADLFYELAEVDQVMAWNGEHADFEMIKARTTKLAVEVDLRRWLWLDHMQLFAKLNLTASDSGDEKASLALGRVAESLGVRGKLEGTSGKRAYEEWAAVGERRRRLGLYNVEDAATMLRIEEVTGFVSILATLAETCGVLPDTRGMKGVAFVESYLLRLGAQRGMRAPTKTAWEPSYGDEPDQYKGAFVFESEKGLHREVHACDFTRLYPSIMQAWNMSPETHRGSARDRAGASSAGHLATMMTLEQAIAVLKEGEAVCPITLEIFQVSGERGLFAACLDEVTRQRAYWSKLAATLEPGSPEQKESARKDAAYKTIANTFYGVAGSPFSRYHLRALAESVTQVGVWLIQATAAAGEARGMRLIGGDTDSSFFKGCTVDQFSEFIAWCNLELYPSMVTPTGADASRIKIAFEKTFGLMLNVAKKCYAGRLKHYKGKAAKDDVKPVIKGLEYKRGDATKIARSLQQQLVEALLYFGKPLPEVHEVGPAELERIVERWQTYVMAGEFKFEEAVVSQAMKEDPESYGGTRPDGTSLPIPAHVQMAKILIERGEAVYPGAKIEYVIVDGSKSPMKCKPAIDATKDEVDRYYLWENKVWNAAERVLEAAYPDHRWKRWGSVRPLRGVLAGQIGFGFGERDASLLRRHEPRR